MEDVVRILCLEDRKVDFNLMRQFIIRKLPNVVFTHTEDKAAFFKAIERGGFDLILSDYNIPGYNGLSALLYVREHYPHLPFIFVTGILNSEEGVASAILQGANGYVLKDNLDQLPTHILKVLETTKAKQDARRALDAKRRSRNLKLQKAAGLLKKAADFEEKQNIIRLIEDSISVVNPSV